MIVYDNLKIMKGVTQLKIDIIDYNNNEVIYSVKNTPICQWDQHSRARIGVKFYDYKVVDEPEYIFYSYTYDLLQNDINLQNKTINTFLKLENIRNLSDNKEQYNLMTRNCEYKVKQSFDSLKGQMNRRLKFCEEEFIVGLHWLLREKLISIDSKHKDLLPSCDINKVCDYSSADYLSNMFGCLFKGCGRWPDKSYYTSFNFSCSTREDLNKQLNIEIPKSEYENLNILI